MVNVTRGYLRNYLAPRKLAEIAKYLRIDENPIDLHWSDRPAPTKSPVILYSEELAGQSSQSKREQLAADLRKRGLDAVLLTQAEPINWLLNLRGRDIDRDWRR